MQRPAGNGQLLGRFPQAVRAVIPPRDADPTTGSDLRVPGVRRPRSWCAGACLLYAAAWLWSSSRLPDRVPTHFGAGGHADQWSSRGSALLVTALLGVGTTAFFLAIAAVVNHAPRSLVNVPNG